MVPEEKVSSGKWLSALVMIIINPLIILLLQNLDLKANKKEGVQLLIPSINEALMVRPREEVKLRVPASVGSEDKVQQIKPAKAKAPILDDLDNQ